MTTARGTVINVHHHGATVRLEDGTLAAVPAAEFAANRAAYVAGHTSRAPLEVLVERRGAHAIVALESELAPGPQAAAQARAGAPAQAALARLTDAAFEARMTAFLKSTHDEGTPDGPPPAERHFIRKKRRAALFEARTKGA